MGYNQILLDQKLVGEISGSFFVPSYQRGYRWGKDEVLRLLNDIYDNGKKSYCLQPIVVRKTKDHYELIDGQQRLTTLYLIYCFLNSFGPFFPRPQFSLEYQTRKQSKEYLEAIDLSRREENIDYWFIANAYETIRDWVNHDPQSRAIHIAEYLKEDVRVIWYEVDANENPVALFTRLNIGKIPLTSAELVKAMFLSNEERTKIDRRTLEEIALQWDNVEKDLHNDSLWFFLTNNSSATYQTRIDLILDLVSDKPESSRDNYYTFFWFDAQRQSLSLDTLWQTIIQTFLTLKDWYENHELYHKIGYLIATEECSLQDLFHLSKNVTKKEFRRKLDDKIREICNTGVGNYGELTYDNPTDSKRLRKLLLLFNVESVRLNGAHTQWFPFDKFKYKTGAKVSWSIEHIHAQHSEGLQTQEMWKKWIELHIPSVAAVGENKELIQEMRIALSAEKLDRVVFEDLQQRAVNCLSESGSWSYLHSISNLALLQTGNNAALNNSTFDVKRNKIIELDKKGEYIPFCTKMVFLKYYTPSDKTQLHFWGQNDRIAYVEAMNNVLAPYLNEPIRLEDD